MKPAQVHIVEDSAQALVDYARVPIAFRVESRFVVSTSKENSVGRILQEEPVKPYVKDYDAYDGEGPASWATQWDLTNWGILSAFTCSERVGGAVLALRTAGVDLLQRRDDLAVLWDLRVRPDQRGKGVGHALFLAAVSWATDRGCRELVVETQNVNVPACRFYSRQGCRLGAVNPHAYAGLPEEVQFLWHLDLTIPPVNQSECTFSLAELPAR